MAGALVGGAFLSASLQVLFDRLASRELLSFFRGKKLSDALLKKLQRKLPILQAVLDDAEVKQIRSPSIKKWVESLKDAVYDAEDILDEINTEALRRKVEAAEPQTGSSQVCNTISTWINPPFDGQNLEARIEEIIDRLEDIIQDKDVLGLEKVVGEKPSQRWPSTSSVDESVVYGRVDEKQKMIELLVSDNSANSVIDVISIVGMGGSGKTTLAQLLYNDDTVKKHFDLKVWVCVSEEFDLVRVTKAILEEIDSSTAQTDNLNVLQLKLKERVNTKKFLLILDDVWNEDYNNWDRIKTPLVVGAEGSKIVVTTRSENVARVMDATHIQNLQGLSPEDCWLLFANRALVNRNSTVSRQLEPIGKKIVAKCKGLPLAVNAVGNLLRFRKEASEWEDVLNNDTWDLSTDKVLPALRLSYYYLPSQLKQCFAYCSIFPKDFEFDKENLILLWMAEGFLQQQGNKRMEKVGELYFEELLSKSFFHQSIKNESRFVMHDLFNDLARLVCGEFFVWWEDAQMPKMFEKARHLSYLMREYDTFEKFKRVFDVKHLRTFLPLQVSYIFHCLVSNRDLHLLIEMRCLRVLSLHCYKITDLAESIGNLKCLRYLDLSGTRIRKLPKSVCALYNLQTLILRHCPFLVELPSSMRKLANLRYLDIRVTHIKEMPIGICNLKSLQILTNFVVGEKSGAGIGELGKLSDIRGRLRISKMENVGCDEDVMSANIKGKGHLDELMLEWGYQHQFMEDEEGILSKLQPHPNLKSLEITRYGGSRFPDWIGDVSVFFNLVSLTLSDCDNCSSLPPLGQLSSLKRLCISGLRGIEKVANEFYGNSSSLVKPPFPSLQTLTLKEMWEWKKWLRCEGRRGEFPCLQELYMLECPNLMGKLPKQLRSLKKLEIVECPRLLMASLRVPAVCELRMWNCGELKLKRPSCGFNYSQTSAIEISDISQWKQIPPGLQRLSITESDSVETLLERMMEINTCVLQHLVIERCSFSRSLLRVRLPTNTLKSLQITWCTNLEFLLPELLGFHLPFLEQLSIAHGTFDSLSLSFSLSIFPRLTHFKIFDIRGLEFLTISLSEGDHASLCSLNIQDCPDLVHVELPALTMASYMIRHCLELRLLKHTLSSLKSLHLSDCPQLLFHMDGLPSNLLQLQISSCNKLTTQVDWGLQRLASLTHFTIEDRCLKVESFPEEGLLPSTLAHLEIRKFPNLKSLSSKGLQHLTSLQHLYIADCPALESLTDVGLQHLISLQKLRIYSCPKLQYLTKQRLPNSLSSLVATGCPLLEHRYQFENGPDWNYIAHIPGKGINGVLY